jgi:hypothetical protein
MSKRNLGDWDKALRLFVVAVTAVPIFSRTSRDALTWAGLLLLAYLLVTSLAGHCFIYDLFNFSTHDDHQQRRPF